MLVADLIEQLQSMPQDAEVHFSYCYGDHWRTEVAPKVSEVYEGAVTYSEYHRMPKIVEIDEDDEDEYNNRNEVVVIG